MPYLIRITASHFPTCVSGSSEKSNSPMVGAHHFQMTQGVSLHKYKHTVLSSQFKHLYLLPKGSNMLVLFTSPIIVKVKEKISISCQYTLMTGPLHISSNSHVSVQAGVRLKGRSPKHQQFLVSHLWPLNSEFSSSVKDLTLHFGLDKHSLNSSFTG